MSAARILITGGTGFVATALAAQLKASGVFFVEVTVRSKSRHPDTGLTVHEVPAINAASDWTGLLSGVDCVIHTAGQAHILKPKVASLDSFRAVNTEGTLNLGKQAADAGVRRFIYISSIGVNGNQTSQMPFDEKCRPAPHADYAISKHEAEQGLIEISRNSSMELVIIRPPLVYAAHAPGNFQRLLRIVYSQAPLPFGSINNARSMIALENLVDFISHCINHPNAANELFLAADSTNVSISEIVRYLSTGMEKRSLLVPVPEFVLKAGAYLLGKKNLYIQLCGSLSIDTSKSRVLLGWTPPLSPEEALIKTGREYKARRVA